MVISLAAQMSTRMPVMGVGSVTTWSGFSDWSKSMNADAEVAMACRMISPVSVSRRWAWVLVLAVPRSSARMRMYINPFLAIQRGELRRRAHPRGGTWSIAAASFMDLLVELAGGGGCTPVAPEHHGHRFT